MLIAEIEADEVAPLGTVTVTAQQSTPCGPPILPGPIVLTPAPPLIKLHSIANRISARAA